MAEPGEWIQGPSVDLSVGGSETVARWDRDPPSSIGMTQAFDTSWGESYDTFPSARGSRGTFVQMFNTTVERHIPMVNRVVAVETHPNIDPGDWPADAVGIEYEEGGGLYSGPYSVTAQYMIDAAQSSSVTTQASRLLQAPAGWPAGGVMGASDFPSRSVLSGWSTRHQGTVVVSAPPLGITTVTWEQVGDEVALLALAEWMWAADDSASRPQLQFHVPRPQMTRSYSPPRHRFLYGSLSRGMWTQRQRHTAGGNAGGLPARQRHNRGFNGSWPERQRHNGI